jgi:hypothetical protein
MSIKLYSFLEQKRSGKMNTDLNVQTTLTKYVHLTEAFY